MNVSVEKRLAIEFARQLCDELGFQKIATIAAMNTTPAYRGACASHDFCDANMIMSQAFLYVFGRESNPASADDAGLWNRAWNIAREFGFDVTRIKESE